MVARPQAAAVLFSVPITLRVWPISAQCLQNQLAKYGKAYGFDPTAVATLYAFQDQKYIGNTSAVPGSIMNLTRLMCERHAPAEALANSWATQRPLSDIQILLGPQCQQPLYNAAFLGISDTPVPAAIDAAYVKKALDAIAPRMEQLKAAGLLHRGYIYAFDESKAEYADALRLLFGEVKHRWPGWSHQFFTCVVLEHDLHVCTRQLFWSLIVAHPQHLYLSGL